MADVKIAIISFEHMHACSYAHLLASMPGAQLVAAAESDPARLEQMRGHFPRIPAWFCDFHEMLDKVETDAVIITSANASHEPIAVECARRGKHILCEKPLAARVDDGLRMISAAREHGVKLMTAFPVRFSPAIRQAKRHIQNGELGRIIGACTSNHGSMPGGWFIEKEKSGGGAVMDHTVHVADLLRYLLEDEVDEVYAEYGTRLHDIWIDDVGQLALRFRKGTFATLDTSWSRPRSYSIWGDVKLTIKGEKANIAVNCFPRTVNHYDNKTMHHQAASISENLDALMIEEFVRAISEDREPEVTGLDGLRALEVALAAYAAGEKNSVVKLKLAGA